jgi:acyl carrier protein
VTDRTQVASRVRDLLVQVLDVRPADIGPSFGADSVASWTSLNHLMLISQLENEFGVMFSNQEIRELSSYSAIVELLERRLE